MEIACVWVWLKTSSGCTMWFTGWCRRTNGLKHNSSSNYRFSQSTSLCCHRVHAIYKLQWLTGSQTNSDGGSGGDGCPERRWRRLHERVVNLTLFRIDCAILGLIALHLYVRVNAKRKFVGRLRAKRSCNCQEPIGLAVRVTNSLNESMQLVGLPACLPERKPN